MFFRRTTIITTLTIAAVMLAWSGPAGAALDLIEQAYELSSKDVRLPAHSASRVVIRQCEGLDCDTVKLSVDEDTSYHLGTGTDAVSLSDFRQAAKGGDKLIYLFYDADSGVVTRIILDMDHERASDNQKPRRTRRERSRS